MLFNKSKAILRYHANNVNMADLITGDDEFIDQIIKLDHVANHDERYHDFLSKYDELSYIPYLTPIYQTIRADGAKGRDYAKEVFSNNLMLESPVRKYQFKMHH